MFKRLVHCLSHCRRRARRERLPNATDDRINASDDQVKEVVRRLLVYAHLPMAGTGYVLGRASHQDIQALAAFADVNWQSLRERIAKQVE